MYKTKKVCKDKITATEGDVQIIIKDFELGYSKKI